MNRVGIGKNKSKNKGLIKSNSEYKSRRSMSFEFNKDSPKSKKP